ncbi:hypothetical protein WJX74_002390 [Apatococcus lobatus]|uniref:Protein kinase domain-containing protein n=1 Tax=Apatococcus lobatus TaxID=904363 RepID=A0AAW1S652_9CHLO
MDQWFVQLERLPDFSAELKDDSHEILNDPLRVSDPDALFADSEIAVRRLQRLLARRGLEGSTTGQSSAQEGNNLPIIILWCIFGVCDMGLAFKDLISKRMDLSRLHYEKVTFLMGYAAAGTAFLCCWLPHLASQEPKTVGPELDLALEYDRWIMLRSLVQLYRLLTVMSRNVAWLPGWMALYVLRQEGMTAKCRCWAMQFSRPFASSARMQRSNKQTLQPSKKPVQQQMRHGRSAVTTTPCGYKAEVRTEQDWHALAVSCCQAAQTLHAKGLVHRDLRLDNVIQLGPLLYTVIDLESAARSSNSKLPQHFSSVLKSCSPAALDDGKYTPASDMHSIGCLLESALDMPSAAPQAFIGDLQQERLDAGEALEYLKSRWVSSDPMQS